MSTLDTYTNEQLEARKARAPEYIRQLLDSKDFAQTLYKTGDQAGLQVDEIGFLFEETIAMLLGITSPESFRKKLDAEFSVSSEAIDTIVTELNETVFVPLRDAVSKKQEMDTPELKQFENTLADNPVVSEALEEAPHVDESHGEVPQENEEQKNIYSVDPYREPID